MATKERTITIRAWTYRVGVPHTDERSPYQGHKVGCCYEPMCCGCSCGYWTLIHNDNARHQSNEPVSIPVVKSIIKTLIGMGRVRP